MKLERFEKDIYYLFWIMLALAILIWAYVLYLHIWLEK
jgi:hypothetical protein